MLVRIQDEVINIKLIENDKYDNIEEVIIDVSYEMTYKILELIDGYYNKNLKYLMIEMNSKEEVNTNKDLHNLCECYLKCTDK
jgi:hypothetical protein